MSEKFKPTINHEEDFTQGLDYPSENEAGFDGLISGKNSDLIDSENVQKKKKKQEKAENKISTKELKDVIEQLNGKMQESNGKAISVSFSNNEDANAFSGWILSNDKMIENTVICCVEEGEQENGLLSIDEIIEKELKRYHEFLDDYLTWRRWVESFGSNYRHLVDCVFKYGTEGEYKIDGKETYISPRFLYVIKASGNSNFIFGRKGATKYDIAMPLFQEALELRTALIEFAYLQSFFATLSRERYKEDRDQLIQESDAALDLFLNDYRGKSLQESMKFKGSKKKFKEKIIKDIQDYLGFIDESYTKLKKCLDKIEALKN